MSGWRRHDLVVLTRNGTTTHRLPTAGSVTIGRSRACDIRIDDRSISRRHAILHVGRVMRIEDLGSANGTRLRDVTAPSATEASATEPQREVIVGPGAPVAMEPRHVLQLGSVLLAIRPADAEASSSGRAPMVVRHPVTQELVRLADRAAGGTIPVLLLGETGVGKELFAERIVHASARAAKPLLRLNCSAFSETLLESELFGHEKGAFSGAVRAKPGLLESADGGTVFLDELGELPLGLQAKLLRVVEEGRVLRVGATQPRPIDVRFISATNRDLGVETERGSFRRDLYFRLNGVTLTIPPLRDRVCEIEPLAGAFVAELCQRGRAPPDIRPEALLVLERHSWPGNVRELRNVIERALLLCGDGPIGVAHLPMDPSDAAAVNGQSSGPLLPMAAGGAEPESMGADTLPPQAGSSELELRRQLEGLERERIVQALEQCGGNQTRAAVLLGISRGTLVSRVAAYGLPRPKKS